MNRFTTLCIAAASAFLLLTTAQAADKKADPTGTWTWTGGGRGGAGGGGEGRKMTLKLKAEGEKLTGSLTAPGRDGGEGRSTDISNGKVTGDEVSFAVVRELPNGNKMEQKFTGKVEGDTIKGKIAGKNRDGEDVSRDWEAKRQK